MMKNLKPCPWAKGDNYLAYHDNEWGVPCFSDNKLFEKICLEGQQAGLSWITVLNKRAHYRKRFYRFSPKKIAEMSDEELEDCLLDTGLIRNRLKIYAIRKNALAFLAMKKEGIRFNEFIWDFVDGETKVNKFRTMKTMPAETPESQAMSKALKKKGFTFVGPTICYAFMQSMGLVDDHLLSCPQHSLNITD